MKNASITIIQELYKQLGEVVRQLVTQLSIPELQRKHILDELKEITPSQNPEPAVTPVKKETVFSRESTERPAPPITETPISLSSLIDPVNLSAEVTPLQEFHR